MLQVKKEINHKNLSKFNLTINILLCKVISCEILSITNKSGLFTDPEIGSIMNFSDVMCLGVEK